MAEKRRTAMIEDWDAFYAWLDEQPMIKAMRGDRPFIAPLEQHGTPKQEQSEEDKAFAEALKSMV